MKENKITCDKCGKVGISSKYNIPEGWYTLTYKVSVDPGVNDSLRGSND